MARLSFRCSDELVERVDRERGRVPRERWLRDAVEAALYGVEADEWRSVKSDPALRPRELVEEERIKGVVPSVVTQRQALALQGRQHAPSCRCPVCS